MQVAVQEGQQRAAISHTTVCMHTAVAAFDSVLGCVGVCVSLPLYVRPSWHVSCSEGTRVCGIHSTGVCVSCEYCKEACKPVSGARLCFVVRLFLSYIYVVLSQGCSHSCACVAARGSCVHHQVAVGVLHCGASRSSCERGACSMRRGCC